MPYKIPLSYNAIDVHALTDVLNQYEGIHHNQIIGDFESKVKEITGSPYALGLNSGTAAIHLALKAVGVGPGDVVIAPTFTYVASVSPIIYCGANPVFIDSERVTWNMDPVLLAKALEELDAKGKRPKAIIVVHAYGMPADMDAIMSVARKWEIPVIEDAAEAFGATLHGKHMGTVGDLGIYSFNNNKSITTFGGGILLSSRKEWIERAAFLATHAREDKPYYEHREIGFNYQISPLQAAYGLSQLSGWEKKIAQRRDLYNTYRNALGEFLVEWQEEYKEATSGRWLTTVRLTACSATDLSEFVDNQDYELRRVWRPMHRQQVFQGSQTFKLGVADYLFGSAVCLPSGPIEAYNFEPFLQWLQYRFKTVFR